MELYSKLTLPPLLVLSSSYTLVIITLFIHPASPYVQYIYIYIFSPNLYVLFYLSSCIVQGRTCGGWAEVVWCRSGLFLYRDFGRLFLLHFLHCERFWKDTQIMPSSLSVVQFPSTITSQTIVHHTFESEFMLFKEIYFTWPQCRKEEGRG